MTTIVKSESATSKWIFKIKPKLNEQHEEWRAFRSVDQAKIEASLQQKQPEEVVVRGGRYLVNVVARTMRAQYWDEEDIQVRVCAWCWKEGNNSIFKPAATEADESQILQDFDNFSSNANESTRTITLSTLSVTFTRKAGGEISVSAKNASGLSSFLPFQAPLQRGWKGEVEIDDEIDELPTNHLVLVVHGIGESLFSKETSALPPFKEEINTMRGIGRALALAKKSNKKTEFLPIEWHQAVSEKKSQLVPATLPSVPMIREFANEALLDAMLLLTPKWRKVILETAVNAIVRTVETFKKYNPSWNPQNISLIGHSLGSVILFEILSHADLPQTQQLPFVARNYIAMGSPIAVFGNTSEDDAEWFSKRVSSMRVSESFRNVFHPNDPVAYKLEPLLAPCRHFTKSSTSSNEATEEKTKPCKVYPLEPVFIDTVSGDDFLNVKYHKATQSLKNKTKEVEEASRGFLSNALNLIGLPNESQDPDQVNGGGGGPNAQKRTFCEACFAARLPQRYVGGPNPAVVDKNLFRKHRIDFCIQQSDLEVSMSEYISAIKAHNSYYGHPDVINFVQNLIDEQDEEKQGTKTVDEKAAESAKTK